MSFKKDYADPGALGFRQWLDLCKWLCDQGILFVLLEELQRIAPRPVIVQVQNLFAIHKAALCRRILYLQRFSEVAKREHLVFAVIKGMASSKQLYESEFLRQSGDIDILVHSDDIPKADYVARKAGWLQPSEAFKVRKLINEGSPAHKAFAADTAPFPLRSSPFLPHVTNYFLPHKDGIEILEIHDRFYGIDAAQSALMLVDPACVKLDGKRFVTVSKPTQALVSMLSLHEDAIGVRANTRSGSDFGLKACVDVRCWLEALCNNELRELRRLTDHFECNRKISQALFCCCELFPSTGARASEVENPLPGKWSTSYIQRLVDPESAACAGTADAFGIAAKVLSVNHPASIQVGDGWRKIPASRSVLPSGFSFMCTQEKDAVRLCWKVPPALRERLPELAFQATLMENAHDNTPAFKRVDVAFPHDVWQGRVHAVGVGNIDSHAGVLCEGQSLETAVMPDGNGGMKIEAVMSDSLKWKCAVPSVHARNRNSLYRVLAGWTLVDVIEDTLND